MVTLEGPTIAFYILIAVASIDMPDGTVADTNIFFDQKMTEERCLYLADFTAQQLDREVKIGGRVNVYGGKGTLRFIRFVCAPVPK